VAIYFLFKKRVGSRVVDVVRTFPSVHPYPYPYPDEVTNNMGIHAWQPPLVRPAKGKTISLPARCPRLHSGDLMMIG
jgi:hypothetical protein